MQKRILFLVVLGVGLLACAQAFAGLAPDVKVSPLFQASLEASIARLDGAPVAEAEAAAGEPDTQRPTCQQPNALPTEGSGNTCQSSCNGTCFATCGGSFTCGGSTCSGNTCSSTCANTCVGGACSDYGFSGTISWSHQNGHSGNNWWAIIPGNIRPGYPPDGHKVKAKFDDESSWTLIDAIDYYTGYYSGNYIRMTTSAGAHIGCGGWMVNVTANRYFYTSNQVHRSGPLSSNNSVSFSVDVTYPF